MPAEGGLIFSRALGNTLRALLERDPRVILLGEDIADPYGGAFKVTRGLSTDFPDRVRTTPVSEAAITGIAAGLALEGFRPIVEVMFCDFTTLCFDQVLNHIAKYGAMYDHQVECPVILRTPAGGGRGYGPTHSQSLEKHFLGIPHLRVVAASLYLDPLTVFSQLLSQSEPVLYVEHKLLYPLSMVDAGGDDSPELLFGLDSGECGLPTVTISAVPRRECTVTVFAYGYGAVQAANAAWDLAIEEEIFAEILVPAQIAPVDWGPLERSVAVTRSLVTVEEGTAGWGWGSEVAAQVSRRFFGSLRRPVESVASARDVIPAARHLEQQRIPGAEAIAQAIREAAR